MNSVPQTSPSGKTCNACGEWQTFGHFYKRSGVKHPTEPGHYLSECKACIKARNKTHGVYLPTEAYAYSERVAKAYLNANGIHVLPGKAVEAADVDLVAFGCVWIEVKFARIGAQQGYLLGTYQFHATPKQRKRGFLAHIVLLICEDAVGGQTFHLFDSRDDVFYMESGSERRLKAGFTFRPGSVGALKNVADRVVMTQAMMDAAQDNLELIDRVLLKVRNDLRSGGLQTVSRRTPAVTPLLPQKRTMEEVIADLAEEEGDLLDYIEWAQTQKRSA